MNNRFKKLGLIVAGLVLMVSGAVHAAENSRLRDSVIRMNTCYTNDGAIQFFRGNVAKLSCNEEGGNSYAGSYGNSYGNSYGGAYGSNNGCVELRTTWITNGSRVLVLIDGEWHSVTIGFRSKTCTLN